MGWSLSPRNIAALAAAPFTAGTSLLLAKDNQGYDIIDNVTGAKSAREQERRQKQYQDEVNAQSIELANSAHQREVADLQAAGLNPVLSAGGSGATTPTLGASIAQNEMPGGYLSKAGEAMNLVTGIAGAQQAVSTAQQAETQANLNNVNAKIQPEIAKAQIAAEYANAGSAKAQADYTNIMKEIDKALKQEEITYKKNINEHNKKYGTNAEMSTLERIGATFTKGGEQGYNTAKQFLNRGNEGMKAILKSIGIDPKHTPFGQF